MQDEKAGSFDRQDSLCLAFGIAELDENAALIKPLDDGADLTTLYPLTRPRVERNDDVRQSCMFRHSYPGANGNEHGMPDISCQTGRSTPGTGGIFA